MLPTCLSPVDQLSHARRHLLTDECEPPRHLSKAVDVGAPAQLLTDLATVDTAQDPPRQQFGEITDVAGIELRRGGQRRLGRNR
jgi:hypothetical protein